MLEGRKKRKAALSLSGGKDIMKGSNKNNIIFNAVVDNNNHHNNPIMHLLNGQDMFSQAVVNPVATMSCLIGLLWVFRPLRPPHLLCIAELKVTKWLRLHEWKWMQLWSAAKDPQLICWAPGSNLYIYTKIVAPFKNLCLLRFGGKICLFHYLHIWLPFSRKSYNQIFKSDRCSDLQIASLVKVYLFPACCRRVFAFEKPLLIPEIPKAGDWNPKLSFWGELSYIDSRETWQ